MPGPLEKKFIDELRRLVKGHSKIKLIWEKKYLPEEFSEKFGEGISYEPDVVIKVKGKITHIVEVETDPVRKALVGGACTAAYFVDKHFKGLKPKLYFAVGEKGKEYRQLKKQQARLLVINNWCENIFSDIKIDKYEKIMEQLKVDLGIS
jgi:hypothetical protein